jgi:DNA-binding NarL/FixJ family response regulator
MSRDVYSHVISLDELPCSCGLGVGPTGREGGEGAVTPPSDFPHTIRQAVVENGQGRKEITCLIVDDHEVVREGLRLSLSRAPHIRVVGEASDGATAVALAERRKPDVVIMDVRMPGMDGLEATKILTEKVPETAVLIFTAYSERSLLGRGLESGAKGYILKEAPHQTLLKAIDKVVAGDGFVDPALMPAFLGDARDEMLTGREREILQLLADGMSNADVAARLFISQETVKSHVRHILKKLEADTRTHAVAIALRDAIID